jgi:hypothetical protein
MQVVSLFNRVFLSLKTKCFRHQLTERGRNLIGTGGYRVVTMKGGFRGVFALFAKANGDKRVGRVVPDCVLSADAWDIQQDIDRDMRIKFLTASAGGYFADMERLKISGVGVRTPYSDVLKFYRLDAFLSFDAWQLHV